MPKSDNYRLIVGRDIDREQSRKKQMENYKLIRPKYFSYLSATTLVSPTVLYIMYIYN